VKSVKDAIEELLRKAGGGSLDRFKEMLYVNQHVVDAARKSSPGHEEHGRPALEAVKMTSADVKKHEPANIAADDVDLADVDLDADDVAAAWDDGEDPLDLFGDAEGGGDDVLEDRSLLDEFDAYMKSESTP